MSTPSRHHPATDPGHPDGPRAVRPEEFQPLMDLVDTVFCPESPGGMGEGYRHLFNPENLENLRVIGQDGRIVSHVGTTIRDATILGCDVRVANVGAVSTLKEYRGRGYAGACFDDACANAVAQGVDFMLVSGDRKLYRTAGCRRVGLDWQFKVGPGVNLPAFPDVTIHPFEPEDLNAIRELYRLEPVRFLRPVEEWDQFLRDGQSTHHKSVLWTVRHAGATVAYLAQLPRGKDESATLEEFAGDRSALVAAFPLLMERNELSALTLHVQSHDLVLHQSLKSAGINPNPAHASGTQVILNFPRLMDRLRPLFVERLGVREAGRLQFREYNGRFTFGYGDQPVLTTSRGGAAQFIWGTREDKEWEWAGSGYREVFEAVFPIPALVYGFSYV